MKVFIYMFDKTFDYLICIELMIEGNSLFFGNIYLVFEDSTRIERIQIILDMMELYRKRRKKNIIIEFRNSCILN